MDKRDMSKAFAIGQGLVLTLPKVKECNVAVLFSNQVREKIDANGNASRDSATHTPGGNAPQFDYSQRLELRFAGGSKTSAIFDEDSGFQIGSRVLARCQKSRLGSPWGTCILPFYTLPGYPHPVFDGVETKFGYDIAESMWYFYQNGRFFVGEGEDEGTVVHSPSQGWYALHPMFDPHETKFRGKDWLNILAAHPELWRLPYEDLEIAPSDYPYLPCDEVVKEAE